MPAPTILKLLAASPASGGAADADLLARFSAARDESAFAELMRRHGPIVYRVCRRLVGPDGADDAFQAVFLVLACRADRLRKPGSVGSWLVGVAGRVARQLRTREARRAGLELFDVPVDAMPDSHLLGKELATVLEDELTRLPDDLRDAIVLCLVEGRTQDEAAVELGGSVRTLRRRLERAKALLRLRLERRGIVPAVAAGLVSGGLSGARAAPPELVSRSMRGVSEFLVGGGAQTPAAVVAKGVVASMVTIKHWVAVACVTVLGLGLAWAAVAQQDSRPGLPEPDAIPMPPRVGTPALGPQPVALDFGFPIAEQTTENARSANFIVCAPTPVLARAIAAEAEYQRERIAKQWLGEALPTWEKPAVIRVTTGSNSGGATTFSFGPKSVASIEMNLNGPFLTVLESTLPHEVAHTVFATHFGKALPRWADEGLAVLNESAQEQANHDVRVAELLNAGRAIRLKTLLAMTEYPRDSILAYTQGHSVCRFLLSRPVSFGPPVMTDIPYLSRLFRNDMNSRRQLIAFLHIGMNENTAESWDKAARDVYAFKSVDDLEEAWLAWMTKPESRLAGTRTGAPKRPVEKPDLIPPQKIPGVPNTILPPPDLSLPGRP